MLSRLHRHTSSRYVQAPGAKPREKPGTGQVDYKITGKGDFVVYADDGNGNIGPASSPCLVPPPPARRLLRAE